MFSKETYITRRTELKRLVGNGVIILFGNNEAPANYPANSYAPMRQDSSFLYYFGQHRDGLVGVIDIDNDEEWLFGDDIDVEDIVWMGYTPSVADLAAEVGVSKTAPMSALSSVCCRSTATNGTTVIATDTRSMSEAEAIAETHRIASALSHQPSAIFKKTDSALRGHVVAELQALMEATGALRCVYLPANPSKGRTIRNGVYYINNVPIHETDFSFDPEFPAKTSVLRERFPDAEAKGIIMPDAESEHDIRKVIQQYNDGKTIFAGAADLFSGMISMGCGRLKKSIAKHPTPIIHREKSSTLILCGSTQSKALNIGIPISPMPRDIYDGSDNLNLWNTEAYSQLHSIILTIPHTHRTGKEVAVHLRSVMAQMAKRLVSEHRPDHLIIEGGATAWATLQALNWTEFQIERQIAPGVVQMSATNGTLVTLKPGSYPWGNLF